MAYNPTNWKDRVVEKPRTFTMQDNGDGTVTLVPAPGTIVEPGTPVNAANLNKLEQGLKTHLADNIHIPKGLISMWSGLISAIPNGWALCNGQNGTPDLRDRFILGATSGTDIGETGGENEVTLTVDQMPSHNHGGNTNSTGAHSHSIPVNQSGSDNTLGSGVRGSDSGTTGISGSHMHIISSQGGNQPHENRPAFFKLAFIMKL